MHERLVRFVSIAAPSERSTQTLRSDAASFRLYLSIIYQRQLNYYPLKHVLHTSLSLQFSCAKQCPRMLLIVLYSLNMKLICRTRMVCAPSLTIPKSPSALTVLLYRRPRASNKAAKPRRLSFVFEGSNTVLPPPLSISRRRETTLLSNLPYRPPTFLRI